MIFNFFFFAKMQGLNLYDMWFQQDGATYHTIRVTIDLLIGEFGQHFISRSGPVNWPPRSCDLGYFLLGYVKANVYTDKPASIDVLEDNMEAFIREISGDILERVCQNLTKRMDHLKCSCGQELHEIFLKY